MQHINNLNFVLITIIILIALHVWLMFSFMSAKKEEIETKHKEEQYAEQEHLKELKREREWMDRKEFNSIALTKEEALKLKQLVLANKHKLQQCNLSQSAINKLYSKPNELLTNLSVAETYYSSV